MPSVPPHLPGPGDVLVALPHTLTRATQARVAAEARAALPSAASLSRTAPAPRLVLDARDCALADADGVAALATLARSAAAGGTGVVVLDAGAELRAMLAAAAARQGAIVAFTERAPAPGPTADDRTILRLDDAARARLAERRRGR